MSIRVASLLILACGASAAHAHDMFLKFETHWLAPDTDASALLVNGTYDKSENSIALERMRDVRIVGPGEQTRAPKVAQWRLDETQNELDFRTGGAGTYVVGVSIKPRVLEMSASDFNDYLSHDGVLDVLEARRQRGELAEAVAEKYSKHVKALFQVGEAPTSASATVFGYPVEIVPLRNPFALGVGDTLPVRVLTDGEPIADQLVYASYAGYHAHDDASRHVEAVSTRTDANGVAEIPIDHAGRWYIRLIHMVVSDKPDVDYESNWATLTFEIR